MVESRGTSNSVSDSRDRSSSSPNRTEVATLAHSRAVEDMGLLSEVIANTDGDVMDLFVMSVRIMRVLEKGLPESDEGKDDECLVCKGEEKREWRRLGTV